MPTHFHGISYADQDQHHRRVDGEKKEKCVVQTRPVGNVGKNERKGERPEPAARGHVAYRNRAFCVFTYQRHRKRICS